MFRRLSLRIMLFFILIFFGNVAFRTTAFSENRIPEKIVLGYGEDWAPYLYHDSSGNLTGLDYEIVSVVIKRMGSKLVSFRSSVPWARQLYWLGTGQISILTGASRNAEREEYAYFSKPYRKETVSLFVRKNESGKYKIGSVNDIKDMEFRLGAYIGSYYGELFASLMKNHDFEKKVQLVSSDDINIEKLLKNRVDGIFLESRAGADLLSSRGLLGTSVEIHPMPAINTGDVYVMFSKKAVSPEFVHAFDRILFEMRADGTFDELLAKYSVSYDSR